MTEAGKVPEKADEMPMAAPPRGDRFEPCAARSTGSSTTLAANSGGHPSAAR